jgi:hypothetical protein
MTRSVAATVPAITPGGPRVIRAAVSMRIEDTTTPVLPVHHRWASQSCCFPDTFLRRLLRVPLLDTAIMLLISRVTAEPHRDE